MTIVSIDFSILFPAACICTNFKDFKWLSVVNANLTKKEAARLEDLEINYPAIRILKTESKRKKQTAYHLTERVKLDNYLELTQLFVDELLRLVGESELIICLEGISFGSSGNSLVDISQATGILKHQLILKLLRGKTDRFFIFSPSELKNAIGSKGNANKLEILNQFKKEPILPATRQSDLFRLVEKEDWIVQDDRVVSPISDMVDSYLGIIKVYSFLK